MDLKKAAVSFGTLLTNFLNEAIFPFSSTSFFSNYSCVWLGLLFAFYRKRQSMGKKNVRVERPSSHLFLTAAVEPKPPKPWYISWGSSGSGQ